VENLFCFTYLKPSWFLLCGMGKMIMGNMLYPWFSAFRAGRVVLGLSMLVMQLSLFLWPMAMRLEREFANERRVQALLDQISVNYARLPYDKHAPVPVEVEVPVQGGVA
jgi:hypothetical protein